MVFLVYDVAVSGVSCVQVVVRKAMMILLSSGLPEGRPGPLIFVEGASEEIFKVGVF